MTFVISAKRPEIENIFSAIKVLTDEATLEVSKDSLSFRGMDAAHIAMVDMSYPKSVFDTFEVKENTLFGIRIEEALKCVKRFEKDDLVTLSVNRDDSKLTIKAATTEYSLRIFESGKTATPLPKLDYDVKIKARREIVEKAIKDINTLAEYCRIEATKKGGVVFTGRGDAGEATVNLIVEDWEGEGKSPYGLDYLSKIITAVDVENVKLEFSSKKPMKVTLGYMRYFVAPRVE